MRDAIAWLGRPDPAVGDRLLAAALILAFGIETAVYSDGDAASLVIAAAGCVAMATLVVRRSAPMLPTIALAASDIVASVVATDMFAKVTTPFVALMIALYSLGRYAGRGAVAPAVGAIGAMAVATVIAGSLDEAAQVLWLFVLGGGPLAVGRVMRNRARLHAKLRESALELERDRERRAERAVEDERIRLAGELQAVIANNVSAMVVQAEAMPRVVAAGEIERAERAFALIEETGREALGEMRRLLGILRRDHEAPALAPQPTLRDIGRLIEGVEAIGLEVELNVEGERASLPTGADLAAYRVLEQALEAAAEGGAARAMVTVAYEADAIRFGVSDDRPDGSVDQRSLRSMRERIGLYGGSIRSEGDERGTRVVASLPLSEVPV